MIELFASRHPFLLAWSSFIAGTVAAVPVAFLVWHYSVLPGLLKQLEVIEATKFVSLLATDTSKRKCVDAIWLRGKLVCLEQGGK